MNNNNLYNNNNDINHNSADSISKQKKKSYAVSIKDDKQYYDVIKDGKPMKVGTGGVGGWDRGINFER